MNDEITLAYRRYLTVSAQFSASLEKINILEAKIRALEASITRTLQAQDAVRPPYSRVLN